MEEKEGLGMRGHKKFGKEVFYLMKTNKTKGNELEFKKRISILDLKILEDSESYQENLFI